MWDSYEERSVGLVFLSRSRLSRNCPQDWAFRDGLMPNSSASATEPQNQMEKRDGFAGNHEDYP
jgi:hypothetical protein